MTKNSVPKKDSSVAALSVYRRMMRLFPSAFRAEDGEEITERIGYGQLRTIYLPCCRITDLGLEALTDARAEGW